ncbi:MAG: hypothetical protein DMF73_11030 [Acidobacteria bacterium]|nr:MAG: hypothetical protein DMF73_11030 [Acidobacteriota bacterium]
MKVFLSSTHLDLSDYRSRATEAIERLDQQVGRMEVFGARPEGAREASLREVETCELFVGIYAHRYGYQPAGSDISITEAEYRQAQRLGKPIFCFVVKEDYPWPPTMIEEEPGRTKLRAFKTEIETSLVLEKFTSPDDLALKVATSLGRYITQSFEPLVHELKGLIERNADASSDKRQAVADALSAAVEIANRTLQYLREPPPPSDKKSQKENELSQAWQAAGFKLLALPDPPTDLANRYFIKAEYWSNPELWTDRRVDEARIRIDEIANESRTVLLGQFQ